MNKRKFLGIALILTAVLLLTATGVVAANSLRHGSGPTNWESERNYEDDHMWGSMHGFGWDSDQESNFTPLHTRMVDSIAEASGLTLEEIEARIKTGEHLFSIAIDAGVSQEDYFQLMVDTRSSYLEGTVEEGQLYETDYQWMFDHMNEIQRQSFYGGCHDLYPSEYEQNYPRNGRRK